MRGKLVGLVVSAFGILCVVAPLAHAAPSRLPACETAQTQADLDVCAADDFAQADATLNKLYATLISKYGAGDADLLKRSEQAWLGYRDSECAYETADTVGGTINSMVYAQCRARKTDERIRELTTQLNCKEGDTTCNLPGKGD